jgi:hypothetical protein
MYLSAAMKMYAELAKHRIRCQIGSDSIDIRISADFYKKAKDKAAYQMFLDRNTNKKIRDFIFLHRNKLSFLKKLQYIFFRNVVVIIVDEYVQQLLTIELTQAYGTLAFDARDVFILRGSERAKHSDLRALEELKQMRINNGSNDEKVLISGLN